MKKNFIVAMIAVLCIMPIAASALTADEVQAKINALLGQIASLTAQIKSLQGQAVVTTPGTTPPAYGLKHRICNVAHRNLAQGSEGDDVRGLQEFLQTEGYLAVAPTGYFGTITAQAVAKWQAKEGVSALGMFGPLSRERVKIWCGGWDNQVRFSATPTRGNAPLSVTFNTYLSGFRVNNVSYSIDFGDGSSERAMDCPAPADACTGPGQNTHTYSSNGTYIATLNKITDPCPDDGDPNTPRCLAAIQSEVIGKTQIYVGPIACTKEYKPVCGLKQVVCITTPCNPIPTTYSNKCMMEADGAAFSYEGQCRAGNEDPSTNPQCKSWYDGCNTCSRSTPGGPAMCTLRACMSEAMTKPYCSAYFGDQGGKVPSISGFSGPTTLKVDEAGTWTVKASDPEGQQLSYYISWGDEADYTASGLKTALPVFTQTTSFTHTYANVGTYTVNVIARDVDGKEAKVSLSVKVTGDAPVACTLQYDPVCGRPTGCANTCSPGMYCAAVCQLHEPVTYSNKCFLNAAKAEYLYSGQCTGATSY